ncbi:hypothetical protein V2A60_008571 [Cordyceps javanica]
MENTTTTNTFNSGASVQDTEANGFSSQSLQSWRDARGIDPSAQIRVVKLVHMRYQHPDLNTIAGFLQDFGMSVVKQTSDKLWLKGYGNDQYVYFAQKGEKRFLGGTFQVESYGDLVKASQLPNSSTIEVLHDAPGGGSLVTAWDAEGMPINFIHGQIALQAGDLPQKLVVNYTADKPRKRQFQRFEPGPAAVHKLGHYGLVVKDFESQMDWYTRNINLVPTDLLYVEAGDSKASYVTIFVHVDRGEDHVDHHTFFLSKGETTHVHHCSFEVHDFDTQQLGHQWLASKGYKSVWGVGRHILGSQIFDYWWDTTGNMVEHYADGDLVNHDTPISHLPATNEGLAVWGPELPAVFLK